MTTETVYSFSMYGEEGDQYWQDQVVDYLNGEGMTLGKCFIVQSEFAQVQVGRMFFAVKKERLAQKRNEEDKLL